MKHVNFVITSLVIGIILIPTFSMSAELQQKLVAKRVPAQQTIPTTVPHQKTAPVAPATQGFSITDLIKKSKTNKDLAKRLMRQVKRIEAPNSIFTAGGPVMNYMDIYYIDLSNLGITDLTGLKKIASISDIHEINLAHNQLTTISKDAFTACTDLINLYLNNNAVTTIAPRAFSKNKNLAHLYLSGNPILNDNSYGSNSTEKQNNMRRAWGLPASTIFTF